MAIPTIRIGSFKRARRHSLHSINAQSRKEKSISNKSVPTNILLIPPKTPSFGRRNTRNTPYSQVGDEEESDDDRDEQFPAIKSNINDQTTGTDLSNKLNIFRRIRGHGFHETAGTDSDEHKLTEDDRTKLDTTNVTEFSRLDLDLTQTDNSQDITASDQNWSSQKLGGGASSGNPSSGGGGGGGNSGNNNHLKPPPAQSRPRAGSNTSTGRGSKYSMNDELNLQKMMMGTEMNANIDISEGETERDEFEEESNETMESDEFNLDKEGSRGRNDQSMKRMRSTGTLTKAREDTVNNFEIFLQIRNALSWIAILTIGIMELVYWRYYFLFGILNIITVIMYILLHFPQIYMQLSESFMCSFMLVVIRIFHITCIVTIFSGVETCLYHYQRNVDKDLVDPRSDAMIQTLRGLLYGFIALTVIFAYLQNIFVIKYDEFVVYKWKLFYCLRKDYHVMKDGKWRSDLSPYHVGCDGLITFALLIFTWICVAVSVVCIVKMELIMKSQPPSE